MTDAARQIGCLDVLGHGGDRGHRAQRPSGDDPAHHQAEEEEDHQTDDEEVAEALQGDLGDGLLYQLGGVDVDATDHDGTAVHDGQATVEHQRQPAQAALHQVVGEPEDGRSQAEHHRGVEDREPEADRAEEGAHGSTSR